MVAVLDGQSVMCQDIGQLGNVHSTGETEFDVAIVRVVS